MAIPDEAGAEAVICDLEAASADDVAVVLSGADAVVCAAGAGAGSGAPPKDSVDRAASPRSCHRQDPARTLHATYGETIRMALDACEKIAADGGFGDIPWFSDHAETVTQASLDRIKALGGSVSVQNKMMFQGRVVRPGGGPERASDQIL